MSIHSYLTFNGNCREAMTFYKKCLGGTLRFQTVGESPVAGKLPVKMRKGILQATLQRGHSLLVGTDLCADDGLIKGNSVSLMLACQNEKEAQQLYQKLSSGGRQTEPLAWNYHSRMIG
jgi:PhnB protein